MAPLAAAVACARERARAQFVIYPMGRTTLLRVGVESVRRDTDHSEDCRVEWCVSVSCNNTLLLLMAMYSFEIEF